jgi:hypothetical protein
MNSRMNDDKLIAALVARADEDARRFRDENAGTTPTDLWIENSYTAALPLAKDDAGIDPGTGPHPHLFAAYREAVARIAGEREARERNDSEVAPMPTPGEH